MKSTRLSVLLLAALAAGPVLAADTLPGDAEAIATLEAVNDHEIKAAELAKGKQVSAPVATYAQTMITEHGMNQDQIESLTQKEGVIPAETDKVKALKTKTKGERDKLAAMNGDAFEDAYIAAMVKDHTEVLGKIDNELMPKASNAAVKDHLKKTREHVAHHLEMAQGLAAAE